MTNGAPVEKMHNSKQHKKTKQLQQLWFGHPMRHSASKKGGFIKTTQYAEPIKVDK